MFGQEEKGDEGMARARLLKPEFFRDEDLAELPMAARLLFAGLWTLADREGRLEDRPKKIKAELFPYDDVDVEALLFDLAQPRRGSPGSFLTRYSLDGRNFLQINAFNKHQAPHVREPASAIPARPEPAPGQHSASTGPAPGRPSGVGTGSYGGAGTGSGEAGPVPVPVEHRASTGPKTDRPNPLLGERERREADCLALVAELAEITGRDPLEIMDEASAYDGANRRALNPAAMSDSRLGATLLDLRANLAAAKAKAAADAKVLAMPPGEPEWQRKERKEQERRARILGTGTSGGPR